MWRIWRLYDPLRAMVVQGIFLFALAAYLMWGFLPLYMKAVAHSPPVEVIAHRVIWSVPLLVIFLAVRDGRQLWHRLRLPLGSIAWLVLSGVTISINWVVFVWAVAMGEKTMSSTSSGISRTSLMLFWMRVPSGSPLKGVSLSMDLPWQAS